MMGHLLLWCGTVEASKCCKAPFTIYKWNNSAQHGIELFNRFRDLCVLCFIYSKVDIYKISHIKHMKHLYVLITIENAFI